MPITRFKVVKETYGWAVRLDDRMMSPFRSKDLAMRHANSCADILRRNGEQAQVVLDPAPGEASGMRA